MRKFRHLAVNLKGKVLQALISRKLVIFSLLKRLRGVAKAKKSLFEIFRKALYDEFRHFLEKN